MYLCSNLKKYFPSDFEKLINENLEYLEDTPFETESCGDCSHLRWGSINEKYELEEDSESGEMPCCSDETELWKMSKNPSAEHLTPEGALEWYYRNSLIEGVCERYDGEILYTEKQINDWIRKRDEVIKQVTCLENLAEFEKYVLNVEKD